MKVLARLALAVLLVGALITLIWIVGLLTYHRPPPWIWDVVAIYLAAVFGPIHLLTTTNGAGPVVAGVLIGIVICGAVSWHLSRRHPESDAYCVPLLVAALLWVLSAWGQRLLH